MEMIAVPNSSLNCFQHGNLYCLLSFGPILTQYVRFGHSTFVALIFVFLLFFQRFFYSLPLDFSASFWPVFLTRLFYLSCLLYQLFFEFLIIVFSSLSFLFSSRSKVLISSILFRLSFSSLISMSTLHCVISERSTGAQFAHVYFLFLFIKLYSWYDGRSEHL